MLSKFIQKIRKIILKPQEHLEIIKNDTNNINELTIIIFKKCWRNIYDNFQRKFARPSIRNILIKIELLFKKKNQNKLSDLIQSHNEDLRHNGITFFSNLEKNIDFKKIFVDLSQENDLYSAYENNTFYKKSEKKGSHKMGYIKTEKLIQNEEILKLVNNELIVSVVKSKLGSNVIFDNIWSWWSFKHSDSPIGPQNFHRDYNSINFLKLFVYLTDVTEETGPHMFVQTSHNKDVFNNIGRYQDDDVKKEFKESDILKITGPRYTTFLANTFCLHKGLPPRNDDRLLLCVLYSVNPSRGSPKIPTYQINNFKIKKTLLENKNLNKMYFKF